MSYDFIAIDFETANSSCGSACSVGIAAVSDLRIVDTYYSLIKPPEHWMSFGLKYPVCFQRTHPFLLIMPALTCLSCRNP